MQVSLHTVQHEFFGPYAQIFPAGLIAQNHHDHPFQMVQINFVGFKGHDPVYNQFPCLCIQYSGLLQG